MKTINKTTKRQRDTARDWRVKFLLNQITLYSDNAKYAKSAQARNEHLARIILAINEILHGAVIPLNKKKRLLQILRDSAIGEPRDFTLENDKISIEVADLDVSELAKRIHW